MTHRPAASDAPPRARTPHPIVPFLALLALLAVAALPAGATVPDYAVADLSAFSTEVVVGQVLDATAAWQDWPWGGRVIMTTYTVRVAEVLKGAPEATISVVVPGGRVGETRILASEAPELTVGQSAALFLKKDLQGLPRYWVFGLERGVFDLVGAEARSHAPDVAPLQLTTLKAQIRRAVEAQSHDNR